MSVLTTCVLIPLSSNSTINRFVPKTSVRSVVVLVESGFFKSMTIRKSLPLRIPTRILEKRGCDAGGCSSSFTATALGKSITRREGLSKN